MGQPGLTLVELMVAVALLAVVFLPIWLSFTQSQATIAEGQWESLVINLGTAFAGQIRQLGPAGWSPTAGILPITPVPGGEYQLAGFPPMRKLILPPWPAAQMEVAYEVQAFGPLPTPGFLVCLHVRWQGKGPRRHQIVFAELATDE
ncbi:MAG: hypothetical protein OZSIB_2001 [Candidatus Ozemobacter sibiricus]|uniref:Prepilin-type N-terminal cleavage/methylation domain-containing protein n=1 Tax=Candidatus Ozemobacter sibiricus TaxID=2268124 RepID=A0A367ZIK9_9BACT|nr:MAG: hypothetical protein OZSIB_2001 [Candidatus Ozemobacter sibiricus]